MVVENKVFFSNCIAGIGYNRETYKQGWLFVRMNLSFVSFPSNNFLFFYVMLQVALLCGPPGLGKTTLAHIVAQHAGYSVVEMNARYEQCFFQRQQTPSAGFYKV
jgi:Cdc6-like AAA superfamily ATPase